MKSRILLTALVLAVHLPVHAQGSKELETNAQKFSYGVGLQIAQQLQRQGLTGVDPDAIALAIGDVLNNREMRLSMDELRTAATAFQNELNAEKLAAAQKNREKGEAFLKENGCDRTQDGIDAEMFAIISLNAALVWSLMAEQRADQRRDADPEAETGRFARELKRLYLYGALRPEAWPDLVAALED